MKTIFVQVKCDLGKAYEGAGELVENVEAVWEHIPYQEITS